MGFGIYIHIPYCMQRCAYCDFATVEKSSAIAKSIPPKNYIELVKKEIIKKGPAIGSRPVDTIYFGGGTPSAIEPVFLLELLGALRDQGFTPKATAEITIEINPGTLTASQFDLLLKGGVNRFSVGAQSFDNDLLKRANRIHTAQDTRDVLSLLRERKVNFSADLLFSLPTQTFDQLSADVDAFLEFDPPHISPYVLTLPEGHSFSYERASEEDQVSMFSVIERKLTAAGLRRYEISNFSKPGFESCHNLLYWEDQEYWGLGNSSHSYMKNAPWGTRFWNAKSLADYRRHVESLEDSWTLQSISADEGEVLKEWNALTDFFHTSLRLTRGLNKKLFFQKFGKTIESVAPSELAELQRRGLLEDRPDHIALTPEGVLLSNRVFESFTFIGPN